MAEKFRLVRLVENKGASLGVLLLDDLPAFFTLEEAWRNNQPRISCIPDGTYLCKRVVSPRFGVTFEITGVTGRSHILFHAGNTTEDTQGCILLGMRCGKLDGEPAVLDSRKAFERFLRALEERLVFTLTVQTAR